jgi:hypothetical protein
VDDPAGSRARQLARSQSQKESKITFLLLIVVVPYAIIMTIAVIFLVLTRPGPAPREFPEMLPDNGEKSSIKQRAEDNRPLPDRLKVAVGAEAPLRVGDIEVTPLKVAWKKVMYAQENGRADPEPSEKNALVVTLRVKNVSATDTFAPNDLFFNRLFGPKSTNKPYTCVEILDKGNEDRFYGGPTVWRRRAAKQDLWRQKDPREFIKGTEYDRDLKPGEEMEMIVCTDPENTNVSRAVNAATDLMWRIQLRRGYITENNKSGTVTSVIGVTFKSSDIKNES